MTGKQSDAQSIRRALAIVLGAAALQACATEWDRGVHLPQGDADRGREAFVDLRCHVCHEVEGFDPPTPIVAGTRVRLGGTTDRVDTYGELVTSIANPSHRIARGYPPEAVTVDGVPLMSLIYLNDVMTVQQLVDVVAFLQTAYDVVPPPIEPREVYPSEREVYPSEDADVL
ncbi:MAG: cytochrome C [Lysobacterales bacterium]|nr:MAG: cytochrome C [Xanthomonadales bacterium]